MTLAEFDSKPLATRADAAATIKGSTFAELCSYIADGDDPRVSTLLAGLWISRADFTKEQIIEAAVQALFPGKAWMRRTTSISAVKLAKAIGCEQELKNVVKERWSSVDERGCTEVVLGLADNDDVDGWIPLLPILFELNENNGVRTQLVKAVNNIVRVTESSAARSLLDDFVRRMPTEAGAYSNPNNFHFISRVRSSVPPR